MTIAAEIISVMSKEFGSGANSSTDLPHIRATETKITVIAANIAFLNFVNGLQARKTVTNPINPIMSIEAVAVSAWLAFVK